MQVDNNIFVRNTFGMVGDQFVVRRGKGGQTIIANRPTFRADRVFQPQQLAHQEAFREAIAYAKSAKEEPIYIALAEGTTKSAFNVAVADWFNKPQVLEIAVGSWNGQVGQTVRVKAQDDIVVTKVHVVIKESGGTLLEEGDAVQAESLWWTYTTTTAVSEESEPQITATAQDLAGNRADRELEWND